MDINKEIARLEALNTEAVARIAQYRKEFANEQQVTNARRGVLLREERIALLKR